ncbi:iron-containing redox enzyme family protein [Methylomicrobium sp. Wu6]|uniref:iron-containing redox enzyme family protein n=1 Tax=Methylomicrobium sp. Wu6 TaxID=3107928 RepID=UPI002DD6A5B8|nr:iron-containing redox enzyme family protein [Methylomicrobium sp. Wu6]MEC4749192.1 iron-containing redox enzyme family protein [Methylomicrobium sp. Wu6]
MNEFADPFDPDLKPMFSEPACRAARHYGQDGRSLFHALMQGGEEPALYPAAHRFIEKQLSRLAPFRHAVLADTLDNDGILNALKVEQASLSPPTFIPEQLKDCLMHAQPVILTESCWLRNILQTANNQAPAALALSVVYSSLSTASTLDKSFRALLLAAGLEVPDLGSMAFAEQETIDSVFFDFAALQMALAQFPRVYFPEILGFTFAYCQSPSLFECFAAFDHPELAHYLNDRRSRLSSVSPVLTDAIRYYLDRFTSRKPQLLRRIASGCDLYRHFFDRCEYRLRNRCEHSEPAFQSVAKMLSNKAPAAFGHHRNVKLGALTLDEWFAQQPFDSRNFLAALSQSPYIDRQNPAASPLLKLFEFNGPMFGVLSENDKLCLMRWLIEADAGFSEEPCPVEPVRETNWLPDECGGNPPTFDKMSYRELYYYLVNAELYPEILPSARKIVDKVLRSSRWFNRLPFKNYSHKHFAAYIDALYQREVKAYEPLAGQPRLSRQAYVWGIEQLAPSILTDGCWLQQVSRLRFTSYAAIGAFLYKIYDDETGNGIVAQNHPLIYRQLLDSLHIDLPPIHDQNFCRHPGFIGSAFDIPVYLMAISQFPATFLPELLGLNMAIELSGLGGVYLRLAQELKFWGIDPKIVNVHITIDNLASGHAALAKNAIQHYLDQIGASQGDTTKDAHWRRIYAGYCSLATASRIFKFSLAPSYLYKRLMSRSSGLHVFTRRSDQHV